MPIKAPINSTQHRGKTDDDWDIQSITLPCFVLYITSSKTEVMKFGAGGGERGFFSAGGKFSPKIPPFSLTSQPDSHISRINTHTT